MTEKPEIDLNERKQIRNTSIWFLLSAVLFMGLSIYFGYLENQNGKLVWAAVSGYALAQVLFISRPLTSDPRDTDAGFWICLALIVIGLFGIACFSYAAGLPAFVPAVMRILRAIDKRNLDPST